MDVPAIIIVMYVVVVSGALIIFVARTWIDIKSLHDEYRHLEDYLGWKMLSEDLTNMTPQDLQAIYNEVKSIPVPILDTGKKAQQVASHIQLFATLKRQIILRTAKPQRPE